MTKGVVAIAVISTLLASTVAVACSEGNDLLSRGLSPSDPACRYELTDRTADAVDESRQFPPNLFPSDFRDLGSGLSITLLDPDDPGRDLTLTVPQCKKSEALQVIEARQRQDQEQAEAGIPFEERTYD